MDIYDIDALYAAVAVDLFKERRTAQAIGGSNNIRAKGDGPEEAIRSWIASLVGTQYRVTTGHMVRADGRKSKQFDVIVVRDVPTATMYGSRPGQAELVRTECVAAVGEVKSSWYEHNSVIHDYTKTVQETRALQEGILIRNNMRFGEIQKNTTMEEMARPICGRAWWNGIYAFVIALDSASAIWRHFRRIWPVVVLSHATEWQ